MSKKTLLAFGLAAGLPAFLLISRPSTGSNAPAAQDTFVYDAKGKKDPFSAGEAVWTEARTAMYLKESVLDGIVWDDSNPVAILDGKILKKGDVFLKSRVESVQKDKVEFLVGEEIITVFVKKAHNPKNHAANEQ